MSPRERRVHFDVDEWVRMVYRSARTVGMDETDATLVAEEFKSRVIRALNEADA